MPSSPLNLEADIDGSDTLPVHETLFHKRYL